MPFCLKDRDFSPDLAGVDSVLIVPCRFCPAASLAVRERKPYIELFRRFLRTGAYEQYIQACKSRLESQGIRTGVYDSKLPYDFVVCMWGRARRKDLEKHAAGYDAVVVLGCDAAAETARNCLKSSRCRVIQGMQVEGIMNVIPTFHLPFNIWLEMTNLIRLVPQSGTDREKIELDA